MQKIILWTIGIHLIIGGFLPSFAAGLTYVEFEIIRDALADAQEVFDKLDRIGRLFTPWI